MSAPMKLLSSTKDQSERILTAHVMLKLNRIVHFQLESQNLMSE